MKHVALLVAVLAQPLTAQTEIQSKHFLEGYTTGTPATNDMVIRDLYALSSNDGTKFADWVVYRLTPHEVMGTNALDRNFRPDPLLDAGETLEAADYSGAFGAEGYQRGHLAPLASFKGSPHASQVNYLSNIVPQQEDLNAGPWGELEQQVRDIVCTGEVLWVMTGPLYEGTPAPLLPNANESHTVPTGFWKIVANEDLSLLAAFVLGQDAARNAEPDEFLESVDDVETRSGLDFFRELADGTEDALEDDVMSANGWNDVIPDQGCPNIPS